MKQTLIRRMLITNIKRVGNNNLEQVATTTTTNSFTFKCQKFS